MEIYVFIQDVMSPLFKFAIHSVGVEVPFNLLQHHQHLVS